MIEPVTFEIRVEGPVDAHALAREIARLFAVFLARQMRGPERDG